MGRQPIENWAEELQENIRYQWVAVWFVWLAFGSHSDVINSKPKSTSLTFIPNALVWPSAHYQDEWWQMSANYRDPVNIQGWRGTFSSLIVTLHYRQPKSIR